ncbi:MAG TPA: alpha/beta family hydrolase [Methylomirabilota bacterium]|nr:alpha/beta family hydrolase [Methylomirabilota bacterium]
MELLTDGPEEASTTLVLAHGAGGPMDSPFMTRVATGIAAAGGVRVVRFEFPYMEARRRGERSGPPDPEPVLRRSWLDVIARLGGGARLVIGGKSLGGRIASLLADEVGARGLVCLGYPFHPPGKPERLRTAHLQELQTPALLVQGTRDPFGSREEVRSYRLSPRVRLAWIEDGEHSFKPRASSGRSEEDTLDEAVALVTAFLAELGPPG